MTSRTIHGTGVVPGVAYAAAAWARPRPQLPADLPPVPEEERSDQAQRLADAAAAVSARLAERAAQHSGVAAEVLLATSTLATDKGWLKAGRSRVLKGDHPARAAAGATDQFVAAFEKLGGLMAERTTDLKDIRDRVIAELLGLPEPGVPSPATASILLAEDLAPADTATLDPTRIIALVTSLGGPTSHTSIIARQLGIPCIVAATALHTVTEGDLLLVDGTTGAISTGVDPEEARRQVAADEELRALIAAWRGPAALADGTPVQVLANVQNGEGATAAAQGEAEGVGLFRTELCFLSADTEPTVEEQARIYGEVFAAFPEQKVVTRTLDAGSDKPLAFITIPDEPNPALGVRGLRISALDPGILTRQLDAVALAATNQGRALDQTWVMAPMVSTVAEARQVATLVRERGMVAGVMVEIPSVALCADQILAEVDFLSVGTNDLSQYTMAADRMSPTLAELTDSWQPGVLRLIALSAEAGTRAGKPVGVCGEAAADPLLACVLVGMGISSLSMAASAVSSVGARLAQVTLEQCRQAAQAALNAPDPLAARRAVLDALS